MNTERSSFKELLRSCNASPHAIRGIALNGVNFEQTRKAYDGNEIFSRPTTASNVVNRDVQVRQKLRWARPYSARPATARNWEDVGNFKAEPSTELANAAHPSKATNIRSALNIVLSDPDTQLISKVEPADVATSLSSWGQVAKVLLDRSLFSFGAKPNIEVMLQSVREVTVKVLQCERATVYVDLRMNGFLFKNGWNGLQFSPNRGVSGYVFRNGLCEQPYHVSDVEKCSFFDKDIDGIPNNGKIRSLISCAAIDPLGRIRGVVQAVNRVGGKQFGKIDEFAIQSISSQMAMVLSLLLETQSNPERSRLQAMDADYSRKLHGCIHSRDVIQLACQYIKSWTQADGCTFHHVNRFGSTVQETDDSKVSKTKRLGREQTASFLNRVMRSDGFLIINDLMFDVEFSRMFDRDVTPRPPGTSTSRRKSTALEESTLSGEQRSCLGIVLRVDEKTPVVGILIASHQEPSHFTKDQAACMEKMMNSFANSLERTSMLERFVAAQEILPEIFGSTDIQTAVLAAETISAKCLFASSACVYILNQANGQVWLTSSSKTREELNASQGLIGHCLREAERWERESRDRISLFDAALMNIPDALRDCRFDPLVDDVKSISPHGPAKPIMFIPIQIPSRPNKLAAILCVSRCQMRIFSTSDEQMARVLSRTLSAAFQNCLHNEIIDHVIKDSQNLLRMTADLHSQQGGMDRLMAEILTKVLEILQANSARVILNHDTHEINDEGGPDMAAEDQRKKMRAFGIMGGKVSEEVLDMTSVPGPLRQALQGQALCNNCKIGGMPAELGSDGWHPIMCCPLLEKSNDNSVIGAIEVNRTGYLVFSEIDEAKFNFFCQHASAGVQHILKAEKMDRTTKSLEMENSLYKKFCLSLQNLTNKPFVESIVTASTKLAKDLLVCGSCKFFWLYESDFSKYAANESFDRFTRVKHEFRGIAGEVVRSGSTVVSNHLQGEAYYDAEIDQVRGGCSCRNAIGVPVLISSESSDLLGVLVLYNKYSSSREHEFQFSNNDVEMATLIGQLTTFCLKVSRKQRRHNLLSSVHNILGKEGSAWKEISKASQDIGAQFCLVFEAENLSDATLACTFPSDLHGITLRAGEGIFGRAFTEDKFVINVKDSDTDSRIEGGQDALDFLNFTDLRRQKSMGKASNQEQNKARSGKRKVPWINALCVQIPTYPVENRTNGIVLLLNKVPDPFNDEDEKNIQVLVRIAAKQLSEMRERRRLNSAIQARSQIIQYGSSVFKLRPSSNTVEHLMEMAIDRMKSLIPTVYCAIYFKDGTSKGKTVSGLRELDILFTKVDSDGRVQSERTGDGAHTKVYLTGSPIRIDDASGAEAGGIPPCHRTGTCRILAYPIALSSNMLGVLLLASKTDGATFNDDDELLAKDFCVMLAASLGNRSTSTAQETSPPEVEAKGNPIVRRKSSAFFTSSSSMI